MEVYRRIFHRLDRGICILFTPFERSLLGHVPFLVHLAFGVFVYRDVKWFLAAIQYPHSPYWRVFTLGRLHIYFTNDTGDSAVFLPPPRVFMHLRIFSSLASKQALRDCKQPRDYLHAAALSQRPVSTFWTLTKSMLQPPRYTQHTTKSHGDVVSTPAKQINRITAFPSVQTNRLQTHSMPDGFNVSMIE